MLNDITRVQWVAIAIAALWLIGATSYFSREHAAETRREIRLCFRAQSEARANPACDEPGAIPSNLFCIYKSIDCEKLPRDNAALVVKIVKFAVTPVLIVAAGYYVAVMIKRRRRGTA
jgi:hypothetical protein